MIKVNKLIILLILGVFFAPSISFCQIPDSSKMKMNRISIQTGLFHYFFDKAPILNVNYLYPESTVYNPFRGFFISSIGIQYQRRINKKSALSLDFMSFRNDYRKHLVEFPSGDFFNPQTPLVFERWFSTFTFNYLRIENISSKFDFTYGGGIHYRQGVESVIVNITGWSVHTIGTIKNDIGLNAFAGIDYTPIPWLTLYSKIDFMGLVYLHDKENIDKLRNYSKMPNHYPSRFDLSLRFGIGINF